MDLADIAVNGIATLTAFIGIIVFFAGWRIVKARETVIVRRLGKITAERDQGPFHRLPIVDKVRRYQRREIPFETPAWVLSMPGPVQEVRISLTGHAYVDDPVKVDNSLPVDEYSSRISGPDADTELTRIVIQKTVPAKVRASLNEVLPQWSYEELQKKSDQSNVPARRRFALEVEQAANNILSTVGLAVRALQIADIDPTEAYREAAGIIAVAEARKQEKVLDAEGEVEAINLQRKEQGDNLFMRLEELQTAERMAESGAFQTVVTVGSGLRDTVRSLTGGNRKNG